MRHGRTEVSAMTLKLVLTIFQVMASVFLIAVILLQSGRSSGLSGAVAGAAENFMSRSKAKTWDGKLAKATTWVAVAFIVLTLVLSLI